MRLGISSWALAWNIGVPGHEPPARWNAHQLLEFAAAHGVGVVQIADNLPLERLTTDELSDVRSYARKLNISLEVGMRGIHPTHLSRMLDISAFLESPILRIVLDSANHQPDVDEIVGTFRAFRPQFEAAHVRPAIENHDRFSSGTFARIVEHIGREYAGICLDTVNSFGALEGPGVVIETLAPFTINLHLKDFVVRRHPSLMGFEIIGAPAGQGRLDIPELLDALKANGRDCNAILEQWPPFHQDPATTAALEREWASASIQHLRTMIPD